MPSVRGKEQRGLPKISPPPFYNDKKTLGPSSRRNGGDRVLPQRRMGPRAGLPAGSSRNQRDDKADRWNEWNPGEFQRSYPKSNPQNAAWYKMHNYGRLPGKDYDGWQRKAGPLPYESRANQNPNPLKPVKPAAAARAVARAAKKDKG